MLDEAFDDGHAKSVAWLNQHKIAMEHAPRRHHNTIDDGHTVWMYVCNDGPCMHIVFSISWKLMVLDREQ